MNVTTSTVKAFVSEGAWSKVVVHLLDTTFLEKLVTLGFTVTSSGVPEVLSTVTASPEDKQKLFTALRDEGVCFSAGPGWCPAGVFDYLRDQGKLSGTYRKIEWWAPMEPVVTENC